MLDGCFHPTHPFTRTHPLTPNLTTRISLHQHRRRTPQNPFAPWPNVLRQKYRQHRRRRRDADGNFLKYMYRSFVRMRLFAHPFVRGAHSGPGPEETNKAPNIHINVKYGRFNDTFRTCGVCVHRGSTECLALSCTDTHSTTTSPHTETRVTDTQLSMV